MDLQRLMAMVIHLSMVMMMMIMMVLMMCWVVCQVMSNPTLFIVTVLTSLFQQYLTVTLLAIIFDNDVMLFHHVCMGNYNGACVWQMNHIDCFSWFKKTVSVGYIFWVCVLRSRASLAIRFRNALKKHCQSS